MTRVRLSIALLVLAASLAIFFLRVSRSMADFEVYWRGAARAAAAAPLYQSEDQHYRFKYFPAFAIVMIPLGLLPLPVAKGVWFMASVSLLAALVWLSVEVLPERRKSAAWLTVVAVVVLGKFYGHELVLGQVNVLFATLAVAAVLAMRRGREVVAGLLIALTVAIKPYGVLFLPWLLARRNTSSFAAAALMLVALSLLPIPLYGVDGTAALYRDWWATVSQTTSSMLASPDNVSIASAYVKWLGPGLPATTLAVITSTAALAAAVVAFRRRGGLDFPEGLEASVVLMLIPLLSPQGWDYVLLLSTPAVILLANELDRLPPLLSAVTMVAALTMGLTLFDVLGREAYGRFMQMAAISVCAGALLTAVVVVRYKQIA